MLSDLTLSRAILLPPAPLSPVHYQRWQNYNPWPMNPKRLSARQQPNFDWITIGIRWKCGCSIGGRFRPNSGRVSAGSLAQFDHGSAMRSTNECSSRAHTEEKGRVTVYFHILWIGRSTVYAMDDCDYVAHSNAGSRNLGYQNCIFIYSIQ